MVRPATGEVINLHAYWDRMFGGYSTPRGAVFDATTRDGLVHVPVDPALAAISDPEVWLKESFDAAQMFAYAEPVLSGTEPVELTRAYETAARILHGRLAAAPRDDDVPLAIGLECDVEFVRYMAVRYLGQFEVS